VIKSKLLALFYIASFFPLTLRLGVLWITSWNLLFILLLYFFGLSRDTFKSRDFFCLMIFSTFLIFNFSGTVQSTSYSILLCEVLFLALYIKNHLSLAGSEIFIKTHMYLLFVTSVICIVQFFTRSQFGYIGSLFGSTDSSALIQDYTDVIRVFGSFGNSNMAGNFIVIFTPFLLLSIRQNPKSKRLKKYLLICTLILCFVTVLLTFSRISLILFVGYLIFSFLIHTTVGNAIKTLVVALTVALLLAIQLPTTIANSKITPILDKLIERVDRLKAQDKDSDVSTRYNLMEYGLQKWLDSNILFGLGYQTTGETVFWKDANFELPTRFGTDWDSRVHNLFINILIEGGLVCFVFFCLLLFRPVHLYQKLRYRSDLLKVSFSSFVLMLIISQVSLTFEAARFSVYFGIILGAFWAELRRCQFIDIMTTHKRPKVKKSYLVKVLNR